MAKNVHLRSARAKNQRNSGGRNEYIRRALLLNDFLRTRKWVTVHDLAAEWGCCTKTARRWLESAETIQKLIVDHDTQGNPGAPTAFWSLPR